MVVAPLAWQESLGGSQPCISLGPALSFRSQGDDWVEVGGERRGVETEHNANDCCYSHRQQDREACDHKRDLHYLNKLVSGRQADDDAKQTSQHAEDHSL